MRWSNEWGTRIQLVASTPAPRSGRGQIFFFSDFIDEIDWQFRLLHLVPVPSTSIIKIGRPLLHSTGAR